MKQICFKHSLMCSLVLVILLSIVSPASAQYYMNIFRNDSLKFQFPVSCVDSVQTSDNLIVFLNDGSKLHFLRSNIDSISIASEQTGFHNNYQWVDLGLPSGLLWATCNVGADSPEDLGVYFAWGETKPKSNYTWETYEYRTSGNNSGNVKLNKYNTSAEYGPIDNCTVLEIPDDAARVNWGGKWRIPLSAEQTELREYCTWIWASLNGVKGYKVISKINGQSIFLPAVSYNTDTNMLTNGSSGFYWSSSLDAKKPSDAYYLELYSSYVRWNKNARFKGGSVRSVCSRRDILPTSSTLRFNANAGEGEMKNLEYVQGERLPIPKKTFTRAGYHFIGWNTNAAGNGVSYIDGDTIVLSDDITLYAQWKVNPSISFDSNGGVGEMSSLSSQPNDSILLPVNSFVLDGYYFAGWNTNAAGSGTSYIDGDTIVLFDDITLYAQWKLNPSLSFDSNGGVGEMSSISSHPNDSILLPVNSFVREGYYFLGWNTNADGSGVSYIDGDTIVLYDDITLYAQWMINPSISFDSNGGVGEMSSISSHPNDSIFLPVNSFVRESYYLLGWNTNADGSGMSYIDGDTIVLFDDITLYAQWKYDPFNGHEYVDLGLPSGTLWATMNVGADSPEDYGDYFAWGETKTKSNYTWNTYKYASSSNELTKYCTDSIYGMGGFMDEKIILDLSDDAARSNWGGSWRMPTKTEFEELRDNCTFIYSFKYGENGYVYGFKLTSKVNGNSIFLPSSGIYSGKYVSETDNYGYYWANMLWPNSTFTAVYLSFREYGNLSVSSLDRYYGATVRPVCSNTDNITLYTVSFNPNGGGGSMLPLEIWSDETNTIYIPSNTFIRDGYTFVGWNTKTDGTGTSYSDAQEIFTKENLTLYAQWQVNPTISFDSNGGVGEMSSLSSHPNDSILLPVNLFARESYYFIGWNTNVDGSGLSYIDSDTIVLSENITLYAQWKYDPFNGHEYVDLGLPSGTLWATMNVGADSPEDYGDYFAWGEVNGYDSGKTLFSWETYKYCNGSSTSMTKYCTDSDYGEVDNKMDLELTDDAARVNWGGSWCMPSIAQFRELRNECTWTWTTLNDVNGYKVSSKKNSNYIFLPAAGLRTSSLYNDGSYGIYHSLNSGGNSYLYSLNFDTRNVNFNHNSRFDGYSVRPICITGDDAPILYTVNLHSNGSGGLMLPLEIWSYEANTIFIPSNTFIRDGYEFVGWNTKADGTGTFFNEGQEFILSESITLYAQWQDITTTHNGYAYVDLGLPSGTLWATCNVGAYSPEECGEYFAWGETSPKSVYDWSTYEYIMYSTARLTKYCNDSNYGQVDNKKELELTDDVARMNWGGSWRMPSTEQIKELRNECTWTWTTQNGVNGYKVSSKKNSNYIFLPAAGYRDGMGVCNAGLDGYYCSRSLCSGHNLYAYSMRFDLSVVDSSYTFRRMEGFSVRPICINVNYAPSLFTVNFNPNGGGGSMLPLEIWSDETNTIYIPYSTFIRDGYVFVGWNTKADGTGTSFNEGQELSPTENITLYAQWKYDYFNGHEYVDLGLPSGTLWATCNVGADSPEDYGDYFAWGEVNGYDSGKISFSWETYKYCNGSSTSMTKYCTDSDYGKVDNKAELELTDDVARMNWGGAWRMPSTEQFHELRNECTWTWTTQNGINGYKVSSKKNLNYIFLPAADERISDLIGSVGSYGLYWSRSLCSSHCRNAYNLEFGKSGVSSSSSVNRDNGCSVRPVCVGGDVTPSLFTASFNSNGGGGSMLPLEIWSDETKTIYIPSNTFIRDGYEFVGWNTKADGTGTFFNEDQEFIVSESITFYAQWKDITTTHNGYAYVDLGLPSGTLWATCNVGAYSPEECGDYFAWGEVSGYDSGKSSFSWSTYKYCTGSNDYSMVKYCTDSYYGKVDNKKELDLTDDVARVNWGGSWRMPSQEQLQEIQNECTWTWTTQNGVLGYKVTSENNGKSIFLPAAGSRTTGLNNVSSVGYYWSSSLKSNNCDNASYLLFYSSSVNSSYGSYRCDGHSVRPVLGPE